MSAFIPELVKLQVIPCSPGYLQYDPARSSDNLCGYVDHLAANGGGIGLDGDNFSAHILLEGLIEKESDKHGVVEGRVAGKPLEGKRLRAEFLERSVYQFIGSPAVGRLDHGLGLEESPETSRLELLIDLGAHSQIGVQDAHRACKLKKELSPQPHGPAKDRSTESGPTLPFASELHIIPNLLSLLVPCPVHSLRRPHIFLDVLVDLSGAYVSDPELLKDLEELFVKETRVHANEDGNTFLTDLADLGQDVANHLFHGVPVIAVLFPAPEDRIDHESSPCHLKGLESFDLLVGGLHSVTPVGLIIVHYHRIDAQFDHFGLRKLQSPEEKLLQKSTEEPNPKPGKCLEKTLHGVGGKQCLPLRFNGGRITGVFLQGIEVDEMPAGAVQKKAEQLLETHISLVPLASLPVFQKTENSDDSVRILEK